MRLASLFCFCALWAYAALHAASILISMIPMIVANHRLALMLPMMLVWPALAVGVAIQVREGRGSSYLYGGMLCVILALNNLRGMLSHLAGDAVKWIPTVVVVAMLLSAAFVSFKSRMKYFPHLAFTGVKKENGQYVLGR